MKPLRLTLALGLLVFVLAGGWYLLRPPAIPVKIQITEGAAILYYNSPASIRLHDQIHVGYVSASGLVEVASIDLSTKKVYRYTPVHDYGKPDDHAAPALWPDGDDILVATAFHSSDLFLYRIDKEGSSSLVCHWPGMFSYPRFTIIEGELNLFVRADPNGAGSIAIIQHPQACNQEEMRFSAPSGNWFYSTVPNSSHIAWSTWNRETGKHTGAFIDGAAVPLASSPYDETLMWSLAGTYYTATRFRAAFECCLTGEMVAELYDGNRLVFSTQMMASPHYPTGIVLSTTAQEALFPSPQQKIERRSLPALRPLPGCEQEAPINSRGQYVLGAEGSYLWLEITPPIAGRDYKGGTLSLCLI